MRRLITVVIFALATGTLAQTSDTLPHLAPAPLNTFTLPAGTHVLMTLTSPLHTTSARAGAGVYLETSWPVVQDGQVVIPAHSRVLGEVEHERRPGRVKGRSQFLLHFTSLILPTTVVAGGQSLPATRRSVKIKKERLNRRPIDRTYRIASGRSLRLGWCAHSNGHRRRHRHGHRRRPGPRENALHARRRNSLTRGDKGRDGAGETFDSGAPLIAAGYPLRL